MPTTVVATPQAISQVAQGENLSINLSPDSSVTNKDITGWTLSFVIRKAFTSSTTVATYTKTIGSGISIVSAANGTFIVTLSHTETLALPVDQYDYEIWRTNSGSESRLAFGRVEVVRSVEYPA